MNPQRDDMITRQALERYMEEEDNQWILGSPTRTSKMESPSASIATNMDIWQKNADQRRGNKRHKLVSNATRRGTLPRIVKGNS